MAGDPIARLLKSSETIAVVGLSNRTFRPSYGVAQYLKSTGYRIIPVNPHETEVLGEKFVKAYLALKETEYEAFFRVISSWERRHLLLHV